MPKPSDNGRNGNTDPAPVAIRANWVDSHCTICGEGIAAGDVAVCLMGDMTCETCAAGTFDVCGGR